MHCFGGYQAAVGGVRSVSFSPFVSHQQVSYDVIWEILGSIATQFGIYVFYPVRNIMGIVSLP